MVMGWITDEFQWMNFRGQYFEFSSVLWHCGLGECGQRMEN